LEIEQRKEIRKRMIATNDGKRKNVVAEDSKQKDKQVKRSARRDKNKFYEEMLIEAESAARNNALKSLYEINRKIAGKYHYQKKVIKDDNGISLGSTEELMQRWVEFFYRNME
jgi:hypothetical protein